MATKNVTDATFGTDVLSANGPVLVDFWAEWCGPCRVVSPALEELAEELGDALTIVKVNVDNSPEAAGTYGVQSIPTLILFKDGAPAATQIGAAPKSRLKAFIEQAL